MRSKKVSEGGGHALTAKHSHPGAAATLTPKSRKAKKTAQEGQRSRVNLSQFASADPRTPISGEGHIEDAKKSRRPVPTPEPFSEREARKLLSENDLFLDASHSTQTVEDVQATCAFDGHVLSDNLDTLCDRLRELHRQRQDLHRAEKSLTLQIKAKTRRLCDGDKKEAAVLYASMGNGMEHPKAMIAVAVSLPFMQARSMLRAERKGVEKQMEKAAKDLPVAQWIIDTPGVGLGSLAAIVGECGNLSNYPSVSKLWKRLGLGLVGDVRQQKKTGADGILHGYSPSRRSVAWNVAQTLFKRQSQIEGPYRGVYDARKAYELIRCEAIAADPELRKRYSRGEKYAPLAHAHNRAMRYMEKRFIRDLWRAWRDSILRVGQVHRDRDNSIHDLVADTQPSSAVAMV